MSVASRISKLAILLLVTMIPYTVSQGLFGTCSVGIQLLSSIFIYIGLMIVIIDYHDTVHRQAFVLGGK